MVHAALLLLMLEAVATDLVSTISLKRSTQNLQRTKRRPADYPIFLLFATELFRVSFEHYPLCTAVSTGYERFLLTFVS
jgi:hypothetical protein